MSLFQYLGDLTRRHKKRVLISTGVVFAVSWVVGSYVTSKISEFQERLKEENFAKEQVKRRFKQTQSDCYMTFLSLLPVLVEPIYEDLNVEEITKELQSRRKKGGDASRSEAVSTVLSEDLSESGAAVPQGSEKTKTELWNQLKIESLTRFLTLLYAESLLVVFLHLQLNILSRKSYFETAVKLAAQKNHFEQAIVEEDDESLAEQAFLSFSWWLLNKGWVQFRDVCRSSVEDVFGEMNPREELTLDEFARLINVVQKKVLGSEDVPGPMHRLVLDALLPPQESNFFLLQQTNDLGFLSKFNADLTNVRSLEKLLGELKDYLQNDQIPSIANLLVTVGISRTLDNISADLQSKRTGQEVDASDRRAQKIKLASLLASITKQGHQLTNGSFDNDTLFTLNNIQELDDLSASVYSNFDPI